MIDCLFSIRFARERSPADPPAQEGYCKEIVNYLYRYYSLPFIPTPDMDFRFALPITFEAAPTLGCRKSADVDIHLGPSGLQYVLVELDTAVYPFDADEDEPQEHLEAFEWVLNVFRRAGWFNGPDLGGNEDELRYFERIKHMTAGWIPPTQEVDL